MTGLYSANKKQNNYYVSCTNNGSYWLTDILSLLNLILLRVLEYVQIDGIGLLYNSHW